MWSRLLPLSALVGGLVLSACAPTAPLSAVEAEVRLTQIARAATATAVAQVQSATERAQAAELALQAAQAERLRLENARLEAEIQMAQARATEEAVTRRAAAAREQAELDRRREAEDRMGWLVGGALALVLVVVVYIVAVQLWKYVDGVRSWRAEVAYEQAQVQIWRYRAEATRHLKEAAAAAQRRLPDGTQQVWDFEAGRWIAAAPAPLAEIATESAESRAYRTACKRLVGAAVARAQAGERYPFSERALCGGDTPMVVRPGTDQSSVRGYRRLLDVLTAAGVLVEQQGSPTTWAAGWDWERFVREFDLTPLPHLPVLPPPDVKTPVAVSQLGPERRSVAVSQLA